MNQEVKDWKNHPITLNFESGVKDVIKMLHESLENINVDFNERDVCKKIGVIEGLEALLTYEPEVDEAGKLVEYTEV